MTIKDKGNSQAWVDKLSPADSEAVQVGHAHVLTHGEVWPRDTRAAVFKVNDYSPIVSSEDNDAFADGYIRPLMDRQIGADIMSRYTMFFELGHGGLDWSAYEYVSQDALDASGKIKDGIRENLTKTDVSYRDFHLFCAVANRSMTFKSLSGCSGR